MATDSVIKSEAASGAAIATETISEDATTKHLQRILVENRNTTGQAPEMAVEVNSTEVKPILGANAARVGFRIIHEGATICFAFTNEALADLKANGQLLYATQPFERYGPGVYKGAIYACCPTGTGPTTVRILEEESA